MKTCEYIFNETLRLYILKRCVLCICYYPYDMLRFDWLLLNLSLLGSLLSSY